MKPNFNIPKTALLHAINQQNLIRRKDAKELWYLPSQTLHRKDLYVQMFIEKEDASHLYIKKIKIVHMENQIDQIRNESIGKEEDEKDWNEITETSLLDIIKDCVTGNGEKCTVVTEDSLEGKFELSVEPLVEWLKKMELMYVII